MHFLNKVKLTPFFSAKIWLTPSPLAYSGSATDTFTELHRFVGDKGVAKTSLRIVTEIHRFMSGKHDIKRVQVSPSQSGLTITYVASWLRGLNWGE